MVLSIPRIELHTAKPSVLLPPSVKLNRRNEAPGNIIPSIPNRMQTRLAAAVFVAASKLSECEDEHGEQSQKDGWFLSASGSYNPT